MTDYLLSWFIFVCRHFYTAALINIQSGVLIGIYVCWIGMLVLISLEGIVKSMKHLGRLNKNGDKAASAV